MPSRLKITVVCFNISAVLCVLAGLLLFSIGVRNPSIPYFGGVDGIQSSVHHSIRATIFDGLRIAVHVVGLLLVFVLAPIIRFIASSLSDRKYWAWLTGLILAGLMIFNGLRPPYIPTVLGGLALWGLLDKETLAVFLPRNVADRETEKPR